MVALNVGALLNEWAHTNGIGEVFAPDTGFILRRDPDTVRAPDAAFVANDRLPPGEIPEGFLELVPDLVVEVASPGDGPHEVREKVLGWVFAGAGRGWVVDPAPKSVIVYRSLEDVRKLEVGDSLDGEDVLPGFSCTVAEVFA